MIEQEWRTDLEVVKEQQRTCCRCGQQMSEQDFTGAIPDSPAVDTVPHQVCIELASVAVPRA